MGETFLALLPAALVGIWLFGFKALFPILIAIGSAIACEIGFKAFRLQKAKPVDIASAALTGLLLAMTLPPGIPWYATVVGTAIAIIIAKNFFGGLGYNIFNPALVGRAFLMASWPVLMTTWPTPNGIDVITTATPLAASRYQHIIPGIKTMLLGLHAGSIGETCAIALIIGGLFLLYRRVIEWRIPLSYIGTVLIIAFAFGENPIFHALAGGLMLGVFFMATDPVTSPVTKAGRWIFGAGCGMITMLIRLGGGYPEGVCYAILIMNTTVPLLDKYARGKAFGQK